MISSQPSESISSASSITVNLPTRSVIVFDCRHHVYLLQSLEGEQVDVLHEIHEATGRSDQDITTHLQLLALIPRRGTSVHDTWSEHRAVA
jgi:hypothetical protein